MLQLFFSKSFLNNFDNAEYDNASTSDVGSISESDAISEEGSVITETSRDNFLYQHIDKPTRFRENQTCRTLDLVNTKDESNIDNIHIDAPLGLSDHATITFDFLYSFNEYKTDVIESIVKIIADDTKIYAPTSKSNVLQNDPDALYNWSKLWDMKLNVNKSGKLGDIRALLVKIMKLDDVVDLNDQSRDPLPLCLQLKRIAASLGLYRRKSPSDLFDVAIFISKELKESGQLHGYRWMHTKCSERGLDIDKESVRLIIKCLDPHGVKCRNARKLTRRTYVYIGPNYIWHMDGYAKLKPYGICIQGCNDGFSRNIM
ncbi:unnamed protein product [Mytilus coruscus]|uniref:Integrase core domain-containing protein n=1 Tax=Mytilus coruscus TaxID=42192 RepID=A0A6J8CIV6_MYTCO|nr:unnamed protein product [Mytilus coruscus]